MQCKVVTIGNPKRRAAIGVMTAVSAILLSACGGSQSTGTLPAAQSFNMQVDNPQGAVAAPADLSALNAQPLFHTAPVELAEPNDVDATQPEASAYLVPHTQYVPIELSTVSTRRLTLEHIHIARRGGGVPESAPGETDATPMANGSAVATYTPAQIRVAYNLPALPASTSSLTAAQAAQLGAGQTIYIVDAQDDPNVAAELATFNSKFGLPGCTTAAIATNAKLPLAAPAATAGCAFSVVHTTASGAMTATVPAYDSGWATEIALDVQWSHAIAPLSRIILIEAPDSSVNSLQSAVALANSMGPGIVSMSFGSPEGSWTSQVEAAFTASNMTYLAAAGDAGAAVEWPAVSPHVVAVGGTSLTYTGTGSRSEVVWPGTGGGISQYTATPSYQVSSVPGMGSPGHRSVTDVSFNADPSTGQYLAVIPKGSTATSWMSVGGTSLATPQWAGVIAIANAIRAQSSQAVLGVPLAALYGGISTVPSKYASSFGDITSGSDGKCSTCVAKIGYDQPTGLGTPNVTSLLTSLAGSAGAGSGTPSPTPTPAPPAPTPPASGPKGPVISAPALTGVSGKALSGTISLSDATSNTIAVTISGLPSGMTLGLSGLNITVKWASPATGKYSLTVNAKDGNGQTATASVPVTITAH